MSRLYTFRQCETTVLGGWAAQKGVGSLGAKKGSKSTNFLIGTVRGRKGSGRGAGSWALGAEKAARTTQDRASITEDRVSTTGDHRGPNP